MKLKDLYSKPINRPVNPAVSATKFDPETERIEIEEYVFTDEIINGLYRILDAIKNNKPYDHVGIWIDGYYGSGKSHFLKYLDYCITPRTQEKALDRLLEAVKDIDPMDANHNVSCDYDAILSIANWLKRATIETCIFNLETSYDNSTDKKKAFLHIFWNEFNGKRGLNKFNLSLAQHLEKPLMEKGVFEQFKEQIAEEGGNWDDPNDAADMIDNELGMVLDIACELAPTLDKESIRERLLKRDTNVSIDRFSSELASFLKDKGDDYRLILLADEVSQFINKERDRYLNLQEIITKLSEACQNKVWVACTAQQDLSEVLDDCNIAEEKDKEGKIKGRFEVKVSLKGTQPEVITQKRILDKKPESVPALEDLYDQQSTAFGLQFKLPNSYEAYESKEDFVAYYPFVPYQFKLIMQVFNSFLNLGYVAKEVKGNERSIIKVIHSTAKNSAEDEVGKYVSFDELYNNMFEEGLQARGQKAVDNAIRMARTYEHDPTLAIRVANVLFMICNISQTDQLLFPANIDNVTTLLVNDTRTPRLTIKNEVEKILDFFCDNNIIRREAGKNGAPETYTFYSEEEMKVAQLIQNQSVDNNAMAEMLRDIFNKYLSINNKVQYKTRSFTVGELIKQRHYLSASPDIEVEFVVDNEYETPEQLAITNEAKKMVYYLGLQYGENKRLKNAFYWYCQCNRYMSTPVLNDDNAKTRAEFEKRAKELFETLIAPEFHKILDTCPIISGLRTIDNMELGNKRGGERYALALQKHLAGIYTKATLVDQPSISHTTDALKKAILRTVNAGDYEGMNAELTPPEHEVELYLNKQFADVNVADVTAKFAKPPYGWDGIATLHIINELVRRHARDYTYANNPNVDNTLVANRIVQETNKFTLRKSKAISQELINRYIETWKELFGAKEAFTTTDSTQIFRISRDQEFTNSLYHKREGYRDIEKQIGGYPFAEPIQQAIDLFDKWLAERNPETFFQAVIDKREEAFGLIDRCKEVAQFTHDQLGTYKKQRQFAKENQYNFASLPENVQPQVAEFLKIEDDPWPIPGLRNYIRLQRELAQALDEVRKGLREQIRNAYDEQFEQLETVAHEQNVPLSVLANRDNTIMVKTTPENILVLKDNLNTDAFYQEQVGKILDYANKHKAQYVPNDDSDNNHNVDEDPHPYAKKINQASLQTKTSTPISSEEDIDRYLDGLREQLRKLLKDNDGVMIVR